MADEKSRKHRKSRIGGRDSRTGQFIPLRETERRPDTTQRERIPLPGYGDTGRVARKIAPDVPPPAPIKRTNPKKR